MAHKYLQDLIPIHPSSTTLFLTHYVPGILVFQFFTSARQPIQQRALHMLFPLHGMLFLYLCLVNSHLSFKCQLTTHKALLPENPPLQPPEEARPSCYIILHRAHCTSPFLDSSSGNLNYYLMSMLWWKLLERRGHTCFVHCFFTSVSCTM